MYPDPTTPPLAEVVSSICWPMSSFEALVVGCDGVASEDATFKVFEIDANVAIGAVPVSVAMTL